MMQMTTQGVGHRKIRPVFFKHPLEGTTGGKGLHITRAKDWVTTSCFPVSGNSVAISLLCWCAKQLNVSKQTMLWWRKERSIPGASGILEGLKGKSWDFLDQSYVTSAVGYLNGEPQWGLAGWVLSSCTCLGLLWSLCAQCRLLGSDAD